MKPDRERPPPEKINPARLCKARRAGILEKQTMIFLIHENEAPRQKISWRELVRPARPIVIGPELRRFLENMRTSA